MKKTQLQHFLENKVRYLDGATGSNLMLAGMPAGVCPEKWILEHREVCLALQRAYVEAGSDILYCPTFSANRVKLEEYGLYPEMQEMITELVAISKEAISGVAREVYLAGDLTMTGRQLKPVGDMAPEELIDIYKEQIRCLEQAGVDLLVVETMMSLAEARAAVIAAKEVSSLPVMVTLSFEENGRTLFGTDALTAANVLASLGAAAVGVNCSTGPAKMQELVRIMAQTVDIPIIAKPNAGLPQTDAQGNTFYDMEPEQFAKEMQLLVEAGATVLGGCCGTTPEHIKALAEATKDSAVRKTCCEAARESAAYLSSERMSVAIDPDGPFILVGERINPTGKKALQASLREGSMELVTRYAQEQEACGAQLLDVNMGLGGIDEKAMMCLALEEISLVTNLPLCLDSSHVEVLEAALRRYPGRALINSISMEQEKLKKLLPLAAKYGAMFILLPLSDKGLPDNLQEKKEIIHTILERAYALGLTNRDVIVDALVTTVGADKKAALEALETIHYCKELGLATICGLSNVSFGLPQRGYVNAAFLALAIREGLTMAIANPSQDLLVASSLAADMLLGKEEADNRYVERMSLLQEKNEREKAAQMKAEKPSEGSVGNAEGKNIQSSGQEASGTAENTAQSPLFEAVCRGNRKAAATLTREAIECGSEPAEILHETLLPAINRVGECFEKGKYFLPQLIAGAEAMKAAVEILEPLLTKEGGTNQLPVIVLATVQGDIHDIGKNLVALMLKNHGFRVIDLGKDVPAERIADAAAEHQAAIIGLSALMTTTMQRMKEVVDLVRARHLPVKIMIGGAAVTEEYAAQIGADGYSADANDAVKLAKALAGVE